jgi:hypothetical protein
MYAARKLKESEVAKGVLLCRRDGRAGLGFDGKRVVEGLGARLLPDNITPNPPLVLQDDGALLAILNPNDSVRIREGSACLGHLITDEEQWWQQGAKTPDGAFALFRVSPQAIELVSDAAASRTIWYTITENVFVASTSQRAIVFFLRSFEPNKHTYPWMLSVGTLGPGLSWDSRIKCLPGNSSVLLSRTAWELTESTKRLEFHAADLPASEHEANLRSALEEVLGSLQLDPSRWVLTLSGGYDTRCILLMLKNRDGFRCVTWGLEAALSDRLNDAYIARSLADYFGLAHTYFRTDMSSEDVDKVLHRYLVSGEGRIDHLAAYVDGFEMWKSMFEADIQGVVRGDALGFAASHLHAPIDLVRRVGLGLLSDYSNLGDPGAFGLAEQVWPQKLEKREGESLASWNTRLGYEYRAPVMWAALNELKSSYAEIANPLLSRRLVEVMCLLPDTMRTEKVLFKKIVTSMSPDIPFAKHPALANHADLLKSPRLVAHLSAELNTRYARDLLSDELIDTVLRNVAVDDERWRRSATPIGSRIRHSLSKRLDELARRGTPKPRMDFNVMAFRAYIICKMHEMLTDDARALGWTGEGLRCDVEGRAAS